MAESALLSAYERQKSYRWNGVQEIASTVALEAVSTEPELANGFADIVRKSAITPVSATGAHVVPFCRDDALAVAAEAVAGEVVPTHSAADAPARAFTSSRRSWPATPVATASSATRVTFERVVRDEHRSRA